MNGNIVYQYTETMPPIGGIMMDIVRTSRHPHTSSLAVSLYTEHTVDREEVRVYTS